MRAPLMIEVVRGEIVESRHLVDVAVVDPGGELIASAGDPEVVCAFRSSAKPLQAAASRAAGWEPASTEQLAIACASHNGEPEHLQAVRDLLAAAVVPESALACPAAWPARPLDIATAGSERAVQHNCSGKHAGFLAACRAAGWPLEGYRDPTHPLQQLVRARIEAAAGTGALAVLTDGCGAPTWAMPLLAFARAFTTVLDTDESAAMLKHPHLIGGTDRIDSALLTAGIVTKAGAEGLSCSVGRDTDAEVRAVAMKTRDGGALLRSRAPAIVSVLEQLGMLDRAAIPEDLAAPPSLGGGQPVGRPRVRGTLEFA